MTQILKSVDLNAASAKHRIEGWETCAACAENVVLYTGNFFAAYSVDHGETFNDIDVEGLCQAFGQSLGGDQVVIYLHRPNLFFWVIQTTQGNYIFAVASPKEIESSKGTLWDSWLLEAKAFGDNLERLDFPEVAEGLNFLYMSTNFVAVKKHSIGIRIPYDVLVENRGKTMTGGEFFNYIPNVWLRVAQNVDRTGYFIVENSSSELRAIEWPENGKPITYFDIGIPTIPTEDWLVSTPGGIQWLDGSTKISWKITGAALAGNNLWAAWSGARRVAGQQNNTFNFPHIGIAIMDVASKSLLGQHYIWNPDFAFAWPSLASNYFGEVAMSCGFGGNLQDPQYGVIVLTGPENRIIYPISAGHSVAAGGGHYTSVRRAFPDFMKFCGSGVNQILDERTKELLI
jgi:hypothetical protein